MIRVLQRTDRGAAAAPVTPPAAAEVPDSAVQSDAPVVQVRSLRHAYADGTSVAFGDRPLVVRAGERAVILGPNGAGKTTLLHHVLGLLEPQSGEAQVFGSPAHKLRPEQRVRIATLLQQVDEQIIGPTVWDDVAFTPRNLGLGKEDVAQLTEAALRRMDIWHLRQRVPHALSAGEKRKVALAGALVFSSGGAFGPALFVMDEPFSSLDPHSRLRLLALIEELRRDHGTAVLLSTHFVHVVPDFADTVYVLAPGGRIAAAGSPEEVFARPEVLEALDIEPPVLSQLFRALERRGLVLPPVRSVEEAADLLAARCSTDGDTPTSP